MIKKFAFSVLFLAFTVASLAQSESTPTIEKKKGRPNIPGTFAIDLGFNLPTEKENFNTGIFGSRTLNLYYYYDKQLGKSKFSVHGGLGVGLERYKFSNDRTLSYIAGANSPYDTVRMVSASSVVNSSKIKRSGLITNYFDIPLEFRFSTNPDDPGRSFKVGLGFKAGVLFDSFTKIKYSQDGETKKLKDKQNYNLNPFRYGVTLRVGAGNFTVYSYYSLSTLFKEGKGPNDGKGNFGDITNFTVGITLAAF
jgi:hypothetical protein